MGATTTLERLVQGALDVYAHPDRIPPAVRTRAAIQHASAAGVVRSVLASHPDADIDLPEGPVPRAGAGGPTEAADAVAFHAGLASWLELDDHLLRGRSCAATAAAVWAATRSDQTVDQALAATVAGNELAGRLGLATAFGAPEWGCPPATAAATALVTGLLQGQDLPALVGGVAAALGGPVQAISDRPTSHPFASPDAKAARRGVDSVGQRGDAGILDGENSLLNEWSWRPVPAALEGFGSVWLTDTLTTRSRAVAPAGQTAVEAVAEILARHVKAADKRLRVDQVERIVIRVPAAAAGLGIRGALEPASVPWSVPNLLGVLVARHSLVAADLAPAVLDKHRDAIAHVADRVEWVVDRGMSARALAAQARVLGPLAGDFRWQDARKVLMRALAGERRSGRPSRTQLEVWVDLARTLWRQRGNTSGLAAVQVDGWQLQLPVEVELYTTRGGRWPERRTLPEGGAGSDHSKLVASVVGRFSDLPGGEADVSSWLQASGDADAAGWMARLMGVAAAS